MITQSLLPLPSELGLSGSKFPGWRPNQQQAILSILSSTKPAFLLDAPTGVGKSLIGIGTGRLLQHRTLILVETKNLQEQILKDFPSAKSIKGRNNFKCLRYPSRYPQISASDCTHSKQFPCKWKSECPYEVEKIIALKSQICVTNYSYFLIEANYVGGLSEIPFVVADEVDSVEDALLDHVQVTFTHKQINSLGLQPPQYVTKLESWQSWAPTTLIKVSTRIEQLNDLINASMNDHWDTVDFGILREKRQLEQLRTKLEFFIKEVDQYWVFYCDEKIGKWEFKPVYVSKYGKMVMWRHCERTLGMSATVLDPVQLSKDLGVHEYDYCRLDCPFPVDNRKIYYKPVASVTYKNKSDAYPKIAAEISAILNNHLTDKILIHCVNYELMNYVFNNANQSNRMITHSTLDRSQKLDIFRNGKYPLVLLSPSMERGVDLPNDACRVGIIAKLPFPNLGDPRIKKRVFASKDGNTWYAYKTAQSLVQATGRHIRSETDWGVSYILDAEFERFMSSNKSMLPDWWRKAIIS